MEQEESSKLNLGSLGSFDFTPDWAKKDAGVSVGKVRPERKFDDPAGRKPRGDGKPFGGKPFVKKPFGRPSFDRKPFVPREQLRPLDAEIKVLPETKALGTIIRKLQQDVHAYKLKDLAYFFLDNPQSVLLKVSPRAGAQASEGPASDGTFFQCKACGFASTSEEDVVQHALASHLADYYDSKEIETEPPTGNFSCVAKCGLSGVLLGPPNINEFNAIVREMIRTRYPDMPEAEYRARIEMVRNAETIEAWRTGAVKRTVFVPKGQAEAEGIATLSREQAEGEFRRTILPSLVEKPKHLMITADVAMKSPVKPLQWAVKDALERERRAPYDMCFALRGAFHHRKMHFFRANDAHGPEFVTGVELKAFDAEHAIPELAAVAKFVMENPCSPKVDIVKDEESEKHLNWLVSTGHVVSFTNGVYSAVEKFPKYGPQWQKRGKKPVEDRKPAEEPKPAEEQKPAEEPTPVEAKKEEPKNEDPAQLAE